MSQKVENYESDKNKLVEYICSTSRREISKETAEVFATVAIRKSRIDEKKRSAEEWADMLVAIHDY